MIMEFKNPDRCIFYNTGTHTYTEFQKNGRFKIMENVSAFKNDEGYSFYSNEDYISTSKYEEKISEKMVTGFLTVCERKPESVDLKKD